ncbi:MAG: hypothetical protein ACPLQO_02300 [Desulfotomaculales bacterium]
MGFMKRVALFITLICLSPFIICAGVIYGLHETAKDVIKNKRIKDGEDIALLITQIAFAPIYICLAVFESIASTFKKAGD